MAISKQNLPIRSITNQPRPDDQAYNNAPSPNEMVVDTGDYLDVDNDPERDPVAIISPENLDQEADQLQDLPVADDCA